MENIYVQFEGMVYQQILGIPMGTNCAPLIADLFLFCYERDFMSNLHKSKQYDLTDMFKDTSPYLDDIFTIDNPEFEKHIPDIYPTELQLNKVNTSDKETSFLGLNIKVIGSDVHTSVYDKRDNFKAKTKDVYILSVFVVSVLVLRTIGYLWRLHSHVIDPDIIDFST